MSVLRQRSLGLNYNRISLIIVLLNTQAQGRLKMRDMNLRHQFARVENAGKFSMESQSVKKCLKVVVLVCRVIYTALFTRMYTGREHKYKQ